MADSESSKLASSVNILEFHIKICLDSISNIISLARTEGMKIEPSLDNLGT